VSVSSTRLGVGGILFTDLWSRRRRRIINERQDPSREKWAGALYDLRPRNQPSGPSRDALGAAEAARGGTGFLRQLQRAVLANAELLLMNRSERTRASRPRWPPRRQPRQRQRRPRAAAVRSGPIDAVTKLLLSTGGPGFLFRLSGIAL